MAPPVSRERDEEVLDWLRRYESGESFADIARSEGIKNWTLVQHPVNMVLKNMDLKRIGEKFL